MSGHASFIGASSPWGQVSLAKNSKQYKINLRVFSKFRMTSDDHSDRTANVQQLILDELRSLRLDVDGLKTSTRDAQSSIPPFLRATSSPSDQPVAETAYPDTSGLPAAIGTRDSAPRSFELQTAFAEVKEKYAGRKLHGDLLFSTQRRNVKNEDAPVYSVLAKVAKYCETGLKIVSSGQLLTENLESADVVGDCLVVFTSLMRFIQDEGVQLVVNKHYDKDWATQYKSIMNGQTDVRAENISAMDRTATLLKNRYIPHGTQNFGRGRSRGGRTRRPYRGRNDVRARDSDLHRQSTADE